MNGLHLFGTVHNGPQRNQDRGDTCRGAGHGAARVPVSGRGASLDGGPGPECGLTGVLLSLPWKNFGQLFFLQKSVLMGLNFIQQNFRVVIGSSCRRFLQPKNTRLCYKVLGAKTRRKKRVNQLPRS